MDPKQPHLQTSDLNAALDMQKHWLQYEEQCDVDTAQLMLDRLMPSAVYYGPEEGTDQHLWAVELKVKPAAEKPAAPHMMYLVATAEGVLKAVLPRK
jgi:hypothetical protein